MACTHRPRRWAGQARLDVEPGTMGLAQSLVRELDVAVLGMRYEVSDEFAIALANQLYPRLLEQQQPVDVAVGQAVAEAAGEVATAAVPALSIGTPALFGAAAGLKLAAPRGRVDLDPRGQKLAGLPLELQDLPRFVGRTPAMVAANAALAPGSGFAGVVFHGMAGAGRRGAQPSWLTRTRTGSRHWPGGLLRVVPTTCPGHW